MGLYSTKAPYWTEEEDSILIRLWNEGHSAGVIAERFRNRSRCSVISRAHRLELKGREPVVVRKVEYKPRNTIPAPPPVRRDPCFLCGTRGDIGCQHQEAA